MSLSGPAVWSLLSDLWIEVRVRGIGLGWGLGGTAEDEEEEEDRAPVGQEGRGEDGEEEAFLDLLALPVGLGILCDSGILDPEPRGEDKEEEEDEEEEDDEEEDEEEEDVHVNDDNDDYNY